MAGYREDLDRAFNHLRTLITPESDALEHIVRAAREGLDRYGDVDERRPVAGVRSIAVDVDGMAGEWLCGEQCNGARRILLLHGGGLLAGSLHSHRPIASTLALFTGCAVLNVAYRLAPEHTFPAAHDDCTKAIAWLRANGPNGASLADRSFLIGDSIGGNLATATCARLARNGDPLPDKLVLLSPTLDSTAYPARKEIASDPFVNADVVGAIVVYAGATPREHSEISAIFTADDLLAKFPPTLIQVSSAEYILPASEKLVQRLTALDRRVVLSVWPDMPHVWHAFLDLLPEARAALAEVAVFLEGDRVGT